MGIPVVKKDEKGLATLYVHDRPFFCRAGEIHNSSASDPAYMKISILISRLFVLLPERIDAQQENQLPPEGL